MRGETAAQVFCQKLTAVGSHKSRWSITVFHVDREPTAIDRPYIYIWYYCYVDIYRTSATTFHRFASVFIYIYIYIDG